MAAATANACTIPVFRYALEKWDLTPYEIVVFHRGALPVDLQKTINQWDKPGKASNHANAMAEIAAFGLASAYHAFYGLAQGSERHPTLYWRDRTRTGPTFHIDYVFVPSLWIGKVRELSIGGFETWCGSGLSDPGGGATFTSVLAPPGCRGRGSSCAACCD